MAWYNNIFNGNKPKTKQFKRSYQGANTGRLFADFFTSSNSADAEIKDNLRILRDRARELSRNDSYISRYLALMVSNIIGKHGIRVSSKSRNDNNSLDLRANQLIEKAWNDWGRMGNCTANGRMSFLDCQKLAVESLFRDGEVLIRKIKNKNNPFGFELAFLESDHLDENLNDNNLKNGNKIKMGVELNNFGRPVAYHLFKDHPFDQTYQTENHHIRVPAEEIIHIFMPTRPEQTRGVTPIATCMANIQLLKGYLQAEITSARIGASKMGFLVSGSGDEYVGDGIDDDGFSSTMSAEPGTFEQLPSGVTLQSWDPSHPNSAFDGFMTSVLRSIASGLNISYHSLSNDLSSVNYSSIRQGALEDRSSFALHQQLLIDHFIEPVYRSWLEMAISTGYINLPINKYNKFADSVSFIPRSFPWIDPLKEMQAHILGLQNGTTTYSDIASNAGRDVEELFEQHQKEAELANLYGIETAYQPFGNKSPIQPTIASEQEDE